MAKHGPETEDDFLSMQQEAIMRVREMQSRARATLENAGMHIEGNDNSGQSRLNYTEPEYAPETQRPAEPRHAEVPYKETPIQQTPRFTRSNIPLPPIELPTFSLSLDSEQIMLMLILYLLVKDGADQYLILSLAYILMF